jgi:hypothetical protein
MNYIQISIILLLSILFQKNSVISQINDSLISKIDTLKKDSIDELPLYRKFKLSFNYSSATTFLGRKDSISIPILSPSMRYISSKNYFYQATLVHTNTTNKLFDELDIKVGKRYFGGENYDGSISYGHYFFSPQVSRLNSFVNNDINVYNGYDFKYIYSALSFDYTHGKKSFYIKGPKTGKTYKLTAISKDFTLTWINLHQFYFYEIFNQNDLFIVTPEIDLVYGTQNSIRLYRNKNNQSVEERFKARAVTINLDFLYILNRLSINFSPFVTFPQNPSEGQNSKPYFVLYGGLFYTWKWEHKKTAK